MNIVRKLRRILIFLTVFILLNTVLFIFLFERFAVPIAVRLAGERCITRVNTVVNEVLRENDIKAADLYTLAVNDRGLVTRLEVNSAKVNELCGDMAQQLSRELNESVPQAVYLPVGVLTGVDILSHMGFRLPIYITPTGSAEVDYDTELESAGIGQVNLRVWLDVEADMSIVNPLLNRRIHVTRKLMLVNAVFAGEVPFT